MTRTPRGPGSAPHDGAISAEAWSACPPDVQAELARLRGWFLAMRGALLADVFSLDDSAVALLSAFLLHAGDATAREAADAERRVRGMAGLARKLPVIEPVVRRLHPPGDDLLLQLRDCARLEVVLRSQPSWFDPILEDGGDGLIGPRLMVGLDEEARPVTEAAVADWGGRLLAARRGLDALRVELSAREALAAREA